MDDTGFVQNFSVETWLLMFLVAGACVTAMLLMLANQFGREREVHDLRVEVARLREAYRKRLAAGAGEILEVDEAPLEDSTFDTPSRPEELRRAA